MGNSFGSRLNNRTLDLFYSIEKGDLSAAARACNAGANINSKNEEKKTPLFCAAENGYLEICEMLIARGADFNAQDEDGRTAFFYAAENAHIEICKMLYDKGADLNVKSCASIATLFYSAGNGYLAICEMLADRGVDLNTQDEDGRTAFFYAAAHGRLAICEMLYNKGADLNVKDKDGRSAFFLAAGYGYLAICQMMHNKGANINDIDQRGKTAFFYAAGENHLEVCKMLISRGANFNIKDISGRTPLFYAARNGNRDIISHIISEGESSNLFENIPGNAVSFPQEILTASRAFYAKKLKGERSLMQNIGQIIDQALENHYILKPGEGESLEDMFLLLDKNLQKRTINARNRDSLLEALRDYLTHIEDERILVTGKFEHILREQIKSLNKQIIRQRVSEIIGLTLEEDRGGFSESNLGLLAGGPMREVTSCLSLSDLESCVKADNANNYQNTKNKLELYQKELLAKIDLRKLVVSEDFVKSVISPIVENNEQSNQKLDKDKSELLSGVRELRNKAQKEFTYYCSFLDCEMILGVALAFIANELQTENSMFFNMIGRAVSYTKGNMDYLLPEDERSIF